MRLQLINLGEATLVIQDFEGYSDFIAIVAKGEDTSYDVTNDVIQRLIPRLEELQTPTYDSSGNLVSQLEWHTYDTSQDFSVGGQLIATSRTGVINIYARPMGDDVTGDGSLTNPYATFVRAMEDVPLFVPVQTTQYMVDITGITEVFDTKWKTPAYNAKGGYIFDFAAVPERQFRLPINIIATPTVIETIGSGDIVSQTGDAVSNQRSIETTKTWTVNEHKGRHVIGVGVFEVGVIASNTADTLKLARYINLTAPITIAEPGAELRSGSGSDFAAVEVSCEANIGFYGIDFTNVAAQAYRGGLSFLGHNANYSSALACKSKGFRADRSGGSLDLGGLFVDGGGVWVTGAAARFSHSYFKDLDEIYVVGIHGDEYMYWQGLTWDGCPEVGPYNVHGYALIRMESSEIINGTGNGFIQAGPTLCRLSNVLINDCAGHAVSGQTIGPLRMENVKGSGNGGHGLNIINGAQVHVNANCTVTGAGGDINLGGVGTVAWTAFRAAPQKRLTDLSAGDLSQLVRIWES